MSRNLGSHFIISDHNISNHVSNLVPDHNNPDHVSNLVPDASVRKRNEDRSNPNLPLRVMPSGDHERRRQH